MKKKVYIAIIGMALGVIAFFICYLMTYNQELLSLEEIKTNPNFEGIIYDKTEAISNEDVLGILSINRISLKVTVKEGTSQENLLKYVGHIEGTEYFDGNIGLAGHNRGKECAFFARLNELEKDDIITYQTKFGTKSYRVDNIQVIYDTDWSLLQPTIENRLTMITCISNRSNQRLCVQAIEITAKDL